MTLRLNWKATSPYMRPRVLGEAGRHSSIPTGWGGKAYINPGEMKDPKTLPMTTSITAAESSPPAARVMTTFDAMVVGRQLDGDHAYNDARVDGPITQAPAAMMMRMMTG